MTDKRKADFIAWAHFVWILFGLVSLPMLFVISWWDRIVLMFIGITVSSWLVFRGCWLSQLEKKWRRQHNPMDAFGEGGFIRHYLDEIFNIRCSRFVIRTAMYSYMALLVWISLGRTF